MGKMRSLFLCMVEFKKKGEQSKNNLSMMVNKSSNVWYQCLLLLLSNQNIEMDTTKGIKIPPKLTNLFEVENRHCLILFISIV